MESFARTARFFVILFAEMFSHRTIHIFYDPGSNEIDRVVAFIPEHLRNHAILHVRSNDTDGNIFIAFEL